jgi:hypothetical protein
MSRICSRPNVFASRVGLALVLMSLAGQNNSAADKQDEPKQIKPEEARKHVGQNVRVTMLVRKTKDSAKTKRIYLDSETDYRDPKNLGVLIEEAAMPKFKDAGIAEPHVYYKAKTIQVTGKPFIEDETVFIKAEGPDQITIVKKKPADGQ